MTDMNESPTCHGEPSVSVPLDCGDRQQLCAVFVQKPLLASCCASNLHDSFNFAIRIEGYPAALCNLCLTRAA